MPYSSSPLLPQGNYLKGAAADTSYRLYGSHFCKTNIRQGIYKTFSFVPEHEARLIGISTAMSRSYTSFSVAEHPEKPQVQQQDIKTDCIHRHGITAYTRRQPCGPCPIKTATWGVPTNQPSAPPFTDRRQSPKTQSSTDTIKGKDTKKNNPFSHAPGLRHPLITAP